MTCLHLTIFLFCFLIEQDGLLASPLIFDSIISMLYVFICLWIEKLFILVRLNNSTDLPLQQEVFVYSSRSYMYIHIANTCITYSSPGHSYKLNYRIDSLKILYRFTIIFPVNFTLGSCENTPSLVFGS